MSKREDANKKLEVSAFLQSWKPLKDELDELMNEENLAIESLTQNAVLGAELENLNQHVLQRKAIRRIFAMVEEMRENLHPDEPSEE